ncbi:ECF transporter S component [Bifidobacterium sp. 64T4]|nr:ECF transporter S component [Bifidobacterium pongonis]
MQTQQHQHNQHESNKQTAQTSISPARGAFGHGRLRWTPADIAVGAAVGMACGVIFQGFNFIYPVISSALGAVLPGLASLFHAIWYASGVLGVLMIRKPGAAIYVNLVGSFAEMVIGNQYAIGFVMISAILQGTCSEIPFAVTRYRVFTLPLAVAGGALTAVEYGAYLLLFRYVGVSPLSPRGVTHMICEVIGGIAIAGVFSWFLYRAIARTGALDKLASGRAERGGANR